MVHTCAMKDIRDTIARNLRRLVAVQKDKDGRLTTSRAIAAAAGISHSSVQRLMRPRGAQEWPGLDKIVGVARAFGLTPEQLISEDFIVDDPPILMTPEVRRELRRLRAMERAVMGHLHDGQREPESRSDHGGERRDDHAAIAHDRRRDRGRDE